MFNVFRIEDVTSSDLHPKKAFIIAALDKEIRLSFAARIRKTVPEEYHHLISQELDADKSPDFKYDDPREYCLYVEVQIFPDMDF